MAGPVRIMIDTESLSLDTKNGVVFQIGATVVGNYNQHCFSYTVNPQKLLMERGVDSNGISAETVRWHMEKNSENWLEFCKSPWENTQQEMVEQFVKYFLSAVRLEEDNYEIWCRGTDFDIPILRNLFEEQSTPVPWKYNKVRDLRTAIALVNYPEGNKPAKAHDALNDAIWQAEQLEEILAHTRK